MFENLTEKLQRTLRTFAARASSPKSTLTRLLPKFREALLEGDVTWVSPMSC